jgi:flagellar motor switch protein FliM
VGDFINLKAGDVITLDKNVRNEADIYVQNRLKFKGMIGIYNNKMAVKITKSVTEGEESNG